MVYNQKNGDFMKKRIALLILVILTVSLALVACKQPDPTPIRTRWEKETHVFNVTLADFAEDSDSFNAYTEEGNVSAYGEYHKDFSMTSDFSKWDELRPVAVVGTYKLEIEPTTSKSTCTVKTEQLLYVKYNLKTKNIGIDFEKYSDLLEAEAPAVEYEAYGLTKEEGTTILKSYTETNVVFENNQKQKPLSSSTIVDGFYAGKKHQGLTKYSVSTVYNYKGKKPIAKITINDKKPIEYKFGRNSEGNFIDSNQHLLYLRSLDKSSKSFQDSPAIYVFNPFEQTLQTASFSMISTSFEQKVILTDKTRENNALATNLNVLSVAIDGNYFMIQTNLTDKLAKKGLDRYLIQSDTEPKFTTVRFRVGYLAYEIDYANPANTTNDKPTNWSEILKVLAEKEEDKKD